MTHPQTALEIRPLKYADVAPVSDMIADLAAHHGDDAFIDDGKLMRLCFGKQPALDVFVADRDGALLGYVALMRHVKLHAGQMWCDMHHLYVLPTHRGEGIGRALVTFARNWAHAEGCISLIVGTAPDNLRAQSFYQDLGFAPKPVVGPRFGMALSHVDL